ncbi:MAG: Gfo/Idh/MocA family oxidoreductase [Armatimonadetes bacterium]|nr:Gfo/Idh/MocA family oxidoreductase [Armatimonadota bacterium]
MVRIGIVSTAHLHVNSYADVLKNHPRAQCSGFWCDLPESAATFREIHGYKQLSTLDELFAHSDAVIITSENARHEAHAVAAFAAGKHVMCEKPLATTIDSGARMIEAAKAAERLLMTAFPCRFSPAYQHLKGMIAEGKLGKVQAIAATNRGKCPFGWFVKKELSGGGAMIDHVVHVADLLLDLFGEAPVTVCAQAGNNMHGQDWEDTAILSMAYPSGMAVTLDSSWSYPASHPTWGDVNLRVFGEKGLVEIDLFAENVEAFAAGHQQIGVGANLDEKMIDHFVAAILGETELAVTGQDGLDSLKIVLQAIENVDSTRRART